VLAQKFREAMQAWDAMKAEQVAFLERVRHLRRALAAVWPQTHRPVYLCEACSDYGLILFDCPGDVTCGRHKPHLPHAFGKPCECKAGVKYTARAKAAEDYTVATKVQQPTRVGR